MHLQRWLRMTDGQKDSWAIWYNKVATDLTILQIRQQQECSFTQSTHLDCCRTALISWEDMLERCNDGDTLWTFAKTSLMKIGVNCLECLGVGKTLIAFQRRCFWKHRTKSWLSDRTRTICDCMTSLTILTATTMRSGNSISRLTYWLALMYQQKNSHFLYRNTTMSEARFMPCKDCQTMGTRTWRTKSASNWATTFSGSRA